MTISDPPPTSVAAESYTGLPTETSIPLDAVPSRTLTLESSTTSLPPLDPQKLMITVVLLACSCTVMTFAWYYHLKHPSWGFLQAIFLSWFIALAEYSFMIPANRIGSDAGLSNASLRGIAELFVLTSFLLFNHYVLKQSITLNHIIGFTIVLLGVVIVLVGPFTQDVFVGESDGEKGDVVVPAESISNDESV
jgi:uncharacterized protein (DUF486 family)